MRGLSRSLFAALTLAAALLIPTVAQAQTTGSPSDSAGFLVSGIAQGQNQNTRPSSQGFGFGVKGGPLFSKFQEAKETFKNNNGFEAGIFFGGNRPGGIGVMGEILYAKKGSKDASGTLTIDSYYLEIPVLLRVNLGSANRNTGAIVYGIGGPVFDILLKSQQNGLDVKANYESLDLGILAGAGVEVSRFLVEGRYNWGVRNVLKATGSSASDIKTRSFALLLGVRFN